MKRIFLILLSILSVFYFILSCSKKSSDEPNPVETQPTVFYSPTITPTFSITQTHTNSPTQTNTATITQTYTNTYTFTITSTQTYTSTNTSTITKTHTNTPTFTITLTHTNTSTPVTVQIKCVGTPATCTNVYDTVIIENVSINFGTLQSNSLGYDGFRRRILIKFDLSSIPSTAQVLEARLIFYVNNFSNAVSNPFFIGAYKIKSDWSESTEIWATHNGGDFDVNLIAGSNVNTTGPWTIFLDQALVEGWIKGTVPNYGVLLKQEPENTVQDYVDISMKEYPDEEQRPFLIIKYIN